MADIDKLIGFMSIMQVPFMNVPDALAYCDSPDKCAQAIRVDVDAFDDEAEYRWEVDDGDPDGR